MVVALWNLTLKILLWARPFGRCAIRGSCSKSSRPETDDVAEQPAKTFNPAS
jgi:hypothetical protein